MYFNGGHAILYLTNKSPAKYDSIVPSTQCLNIQRVPPSAHNNFHVPEVNDSRRQIKRSGKVTTRK